MIVVFIGLLFTRRSKLCDRKGPHPPADPNRRITQPLTQRDRVLVAPLCRANQAALRVGEAAIWGRGAN